MCSVHVTVAGAKCMYAPHSFNATTNHTCTAAQCNELRQNLADINTTNNTNGMCRMCTLG